MIRARTVLHDSATAGKLRRSCGFHVDNCGFISERFDAAVGCGGVAAGRLPFDRGAGPQSCGSARDLAQAEGTLCQDASERLTREQSPDGEAQTIQAGR